MKQIIAIIKKSSFNSKSKAEQVYHNFDALNDHLFEIFSPVAPLHG